MYAAALVPGPNNGWHDRSVATAGLESWPKLAVHDGIGVGAISRADGVAKAGGRAPRKVNDVLTAGCFGPGTISASRSVECRLAAQVPRGFRCPYDCVRS